MLHCVAVIALSADQFLNWLFCTLAKHFGRVSFCKQVNFGMLKNVLNKGKVFTMMQLVRRLDFPGAGIPLTPAEAEKLRISACRLLIDRSHSLVPLFQLQPPKNVTLSLKQCTFKRSAAFDDEVVKQSSKK